MSFTAVLATGDKKGEGGRVICCTQLANHFLFCLKHVSWGTAKFITNQSGAKIPISLGGQYSFANKYNTLAHKRVLREDEGAQVPG